MAKIISFLYGKKTYLAAAIGVVLTGLYGMGFIDRDVFDLLATAAGFLGLGFLRASVK